MGEPAPTARRDAKRDAILEVAREVFFEDGYAAASMSSIAARLGGSKGTLYNYFKSKEELFETHVRETCARFGSPLFHILTWRDGDGAAELHRTLVEAGEHFLDFLMSEIAMRTFQLVTAEARRQPHLARVFYESGPEAGLARMTAYLESAKAAGLIDPPDCEIAGEQLMAMFRGHIYLRYSLDLIPRPTLAQIRVEIERAAEMFLAAYGVTTR